MQVIAEYFLPTAFDEGSQNVVLETIENKVALLINRIEMSEGYRRYRRERHVRGSYKPPILIPVDGKTTSHLKMMDCFKNMLTQKVTDVPHKLVIDEAGVITTHRPRLRAKASVLGTHYLSESDL